MKKILDEVREHKSHYLVLLFILLTGGFSFYFLRRSPQGQIVSAFLTACFYVGWGIIHHRLEGNLHLRVIMEYMAMGILGFIILRMIILRV